MIATITGTLARVEEDSIHLRVGGITYRILVPASLLERLRARWRSGAGQGGEDGEEMTFHTLYYIEGSAGMGNAYPRLVGFLHPKDREFFERYTAVPGLGVRKALRSLTLSVRRLAEAIEHGDTAALVRLPEIGKRTAEKIVAELRGKVYEFALIPSEGEEGPEEPAPEDDGLRPQVIEVFTQLGYKRADADALVRDALDRDPALDSVDAVVKEVFRKKG
ncbi:MAG: Holliday junction branch migration protein RuvA [Nitrospinota bacterium]|jgi:Holliday junction DNA helicase RuvA|nr:Holliday junction branch migration protein RuvA [Nitrospinota bacterium]MDP6483345.1 Holliday junction branch migration protein RuvA [Nitrospinota bacterium]MDP6618084.1 Holliday junction branch migration protein RuvA [Nitrospinota bacterium]MDP7385604.1 Holliday junction branch migration protein RuvA [Nitrospinota bacterium]HJM43987.1 Holliday junction branch migration protein RuvA [Nitrospinota bacterium]